MALGFLKIFKASAPRVPDTGIFFYNTLTGRKEPFRPLKAGRVGMYHCGPTVYGFAHIGHARPYLFADILKRLFRYKGYKVTQVINITDVGHLTDDEDQGQDKMEEGAKREHKTAVEIARFYTEDFLENLKKLNVDTEETIFP